MFSLEIKISSDLNFLPAEIEQYSKLLSEQIPIEARRIVDGSTPSGRVYRKGAITKRATKGLLNLGLQRKGKTRVLAGSKIHRASAKGQPWAKDSGKAYRDIKVIRSGRGTYRVVFGAPYIGYLEFTLDRPVILPAIEAAAKKVFDV